MSCTRFALYVFLLLKLKSKANVAVVVYMNYCFYNSVTKNIQMFGLTFCVYFKHYCFKNVLSDVSITLWFYD